MAKSNKLGVGLVLGAVAATAAGIAGIFFNPKTGKKNRAAVAKEIATIKRKVKTVKAKVVAKKSGKKKK